MENINFTAIDIETTGNTNWTAIHFAVCRVINGEIVESFCKKINPEYEFCSYQEFLLDIKREDYADCPIFPEVYNELMPILKESEYVVAHNSKLDFETLFYAAERYKQPLPSFDNIIDSMSVSRKILTDRKSVV